MKRHGLGMIIGCGLPLVLFVVLPKFGVSANLTMILAIGLMLACHLFMGMRHRGRDREE
jgi:hypothetical protein